MLDVGLLYVFVGTLIIPIKGCQHKGGTPQVIIVVSIVITLFRGLVTPTAMNRAVAKLGEHPRHIIAATAMGRGRTKNGKMVKGRTRTTERSPATTEKNRLETGEMVSSWWHD